MTRCRLLLVAATVPCAALLACTSILGIGELPNVDEDAGTSPVVLTGGDAGDQATDDATVINAGEGGLGFFEDDATAASLKDYDAQATLFGDLGAGFASAVAVSPDGTWIAVGAPLYDAGVSGIDSGYPTGEVFLYAREADGGWPAMPTQTLHGSDAVLTKGGLGSEFGFHVAFSPDGTDLFVAAPRSDLNAYLGGAVFLYVLTEPDAGAPVVTPGNDASVSGADAGPYWAYQDGWKGVSPNPGDHAYYGLSILTGPPLTAAGRYHVWIGAPARGAVTTPEPGTVYSFEPGPVGGATKSWPPVQSPQAGDYFGTSLSATADGIVAVGANYGSYVDGGPSPATVNDGNVYVLDYRGTYHDLDGGYQTTAPTVSLVTHHTGRGAQLGGAVLINPRGDGILASGATYEDNAGVVGDFVYAPAPGWSEPYESLGSSGSRYGLTMAQNALGYFISAPSATWESAVGGGLVYWVQGTAIREIVPESPRSDAEFGAAIDTTPDGATVVIAAPAALSGDVTPAVYIYR